MLALRCERSMVLTFCLVIWFISHFPDILWWRTRTFIARSRFGQTFMPFHRCVLEDTLPSILHSTFDPTSFSAAWSVITAVLRLCLNRETPVKPLKDWVAICATGKSNIVSWWPWMDKIKGTPSPADLLLSSNISSRCIKCQNFRSEDKDGELILWENMNGSCIVLDQGSSMFVHACKACNSDLKTSWTRHHHLKKSDTT